MCPFLTPPFPLPNLTSDIFNHTQNLNHESIQFVKPLSRVYGAREGWGRKEGGKEAYGKQEEGRITCIEGREIIAEIK